MLTDIYDQTKDVMQTKLAAGHSTSATTLKYYVKGRGAAQTSASVIDQVYGTQG